MNIYSGNDEEIGKRDKWLREVWCGPIWWLLGSTQPIGRTVDTPPPFLFILQSQCGLRIFTMILMCHKSCHECLCKCGRNMQQDRKSDPSVNSISSKLPTLPTSLWLRQPQWYSLEPKCWESKPNLTLTFWETDFWHNCCTWAIVTFLWRGWGQISDTIPTTRIYGICLKTVHSSIKQKLPKGTFSPKPIPRKHCCAAQKLENCW